MKTQIERAEPSRGAPQSAEQFYDDVYEGDNGCKLFNSEVAKEAFKFAEAYAKFGHVVLLEALRRAHLYFLQSNDLTAEDWEVLDEMRAAIQQAERT